MSVDGKLLFGREYSVVVAPVGDVFGLDVSLLRIEFRVKKTLKPDPNTCEIRIYNLAEGSRHILESADKLIVRLEAGYADTGTSQIFLGEVRSAFTVAEGDGDIITTITSGDSAKEMSEARLRMTVSAGMSAETVLMAVVDALGVHPGNIAEAAALLRTKGATSMFGAYGSAVTGNVARLLTDICRSGGLEWSIQDGVLQILNINKPTTEESVLLSPSTGLIGSPAVDFSASSKTKKGGITVKAKCLIIPGLAPGRLVVMQSKFVTGGFRVEAVDFEGDSHGEAWFCHLTLRAL